MGLNVKLKLSDTMKHSDKVQKIPREPNVKLKRSDTMNHYHMPTTKVRLLYGGRSCRCNSVVAVVPVMVVVVDVVVVVVVVAVVVVVVFV